VQQIDGGEQLTYTVVFDDDGVVQRLPSNKLKGIVRTAVVINNLEPQEILNKNTKKSKTPVNKNNLNEKNEKSKTPVNKNNLNEKNEKSKTPVNKNKLNAQPKKAKKKGIEINSQNRVLRSQVNNKK
jgi:hypothetical protein